MPPKTLLLTLLLTATAMTHPVCAKPSNNPFGDKPNPFASKPNLFPSANDTREQGSLVQQLEDGSYQRRALKKAIVGNLKKKCAAQNKDKSACNCQISSIEYNLSDSLLESSLQAYSSQDRVLQALQLPKLQAASREVLRDCPGTSLEWLKKTP